MLNPRVYRHFNAYIRNAGSLARPWKVYNFTALEVSSMELMVEGESATIIGISEDEDSLSLILRTFSLTGTETS